MLKKIIMGGGILITLLILFTGCEENVLGSKASQIGLSNSDWTNYFIRMEGTVIVVDSGIHETLEVGGSAQINGSNFIFGDSGLTLNITGNSNTVARNVVNGMNLEEANLNKDLDIGDLEANLRGIFPDFGNHDLAPAGEDFYLISGSESTLVSILLDGNQVSLIWNYVIPDTLGTQPFYFYNIKTTMRANRVIEN